MTHQTHDMRPDGTCDDGSRYRCVSCQVCATWPEARARCGAIAEEQGPRKAAKPRRLGPRSSIVEGVPPNRVCAVPGCARPYHSKHVGSRYCSQRCAKVAWDAQHNQSQRKLEARKRETGRAARQPTRSASEGSRTGAGPSEADNAAQGREEAAE